MKKTALVMTWFAAMAASAGIVKLTSIGPVVLVISIQRGMGVHVGDALVLIPLAVAGVVTAMLLKNTAPAQF